MTSVGRHIPETSSITDEEIDGLIHEHANSLRQLDGSWRSDLRALVRAAMRMENEACAEFVLNNRFAYHSEAPHHRADREDPDTASRTMSAAIRARWLKGDDDARD